MRVALLLWIWICAYLNCAGWALSALHELNGPGYAAAILTGVAGLLIWRKRIALPRCSQKGWFRLCRRFRRPFPLAFLALAALAFLGGAIYPPSNYDGLAYRVPRVLHWLAAGQWHWIHSIFPRVNARGCGIEWVSAPLIALTKTDRLLFLINIVSFLLLPGLIYSVFTRLGVRRRAAWHWMWITPTGYCFLLQAGSIGNDLFGATFALAAIDFALRAKISRSPRDVFASLLAAALLTGAKANGIPLLLPWGLAILPLLPLLFRWPLRTAFIGVVAIAASFLPNAFFNAQHYHDWSGTKVETSVAKNDPPLRLAANLGLITVQNLAPPVFPLASAWNHAVKAHMPAGLSLRLHQALAEPGAAEFTLEEMQMEENAGLGFGVSLLVMASVAAALRRPKAGPFRKWFDSREALWLVSLRTAPLVSTLALASQSEITGIARVLTPYYILVLPWFLASPAQAQLVNRCWWRLAAGVVFLLAALLLVISPPRPLYPAATIFSALHSRRPQSAALARAATVYTVYQNRHDAFAPVRTHLPPDTVVLGLFTYDDPETSLWRPFGSRRIEHIRPGDTAEDLRQRGIHYVLIPPDKLKTWFRVDPADWVRGLPGEVIQKIPLELRIQDGTNDWWLVKLP